MLTAAQNFTAAILTVQSVSRAIGVLHSPWAARGGARPANLIGRSVILHGPGPAAMVRLLPIPHALFSIHTCMIINT